MRYFLRGFLGRDPYGGGLSTLGEASWSMYFAGANVAAAAAIAAIIATIVGLGALAGQLTS